jgi:hypothetical protein
MPEGVAHGERRDLWRGLTADGTEAFSNGEQHHPGGDDFGYVRIDVPTGPGSGLRTDRYFHEPTPRKMMDAVPIVSSAP